MPLQACLLFVFFPAPFPSFGSVFSPAPSPSLFTAPPPSFPSPAPLPSISSSFPSRYLLSPGAPSSPAPALSCPSAPFFSDTVRSNRIERRAYVRSCLAEQRAFVRSYLAERRAMAPVLRHRSSLTPSAPFPFGIVRPNRTEWKALKWGKGAEKGGRRWKGGVALRRENGAIMKRRCLGEERETGVGRGKKKR